MAGSYLSPVSSSPGRGTTTRSALTGPSLWTARIIWVVAAFSIGLAVIMLPTSYQSTINLTALEYARTETEIAAIRAGLVELGITDLVYAILAYLPGVVVGLVFIVSSVLIFWQSKTKWLSLLLSFSFVTLGSSFIIGFGTARDDALFTFVSVVGGLGFFSIFLLIYLFPDGRFVPSWTRWILVGIVAWGAVFVVIPESPITGSSPLVPLIGLLTIFVAPLYAQIYRFRRVSTPTQRQQTKWALLAFATLVTTSMFTTIFSIVVSLIDSSNTALAIAHLISQISVIFYVFLPIAVVAAMYRYRLWDVDFLINRSLIYGGLTLLLGITFAVGFFVVQAGAEAVLGGEQSTVAVVASTALVVGLFNPARVRLRRFVDRRIYGIKINYDKPDTPSPSPIANSRLVRTDFGAYEGLESVGRGGMGEVYKARHPLLHRTVAIKVLPLQLARKDDFRKRFEREAQVVSGLKHPHIVQLFDFGEAEGTYYMVMEYINGPDLGDVIRDSAPLPLDRVATITADVAAALDYAHSQGLVHRDVKPSNVMIEPITATGQTDKTERAVLMDFGIARIAAGGTRLTASGFIGTMDYVAPEQIQDATDVDGRADIYALVVMVYEMLTGERPFMQSNVGAVLIAHLTQPAPDPRILRPDLPDHVADALLKALEKRPADRYPTAGEFATAMQ